MCTFGVFGVSCEAPAAPKHQKKMDYIVLAPASFSAGPPKNSLFFFFSLSRHIFLSFFPLLGVSLSFGGVFEVHDPQMCTFWDPNVYVRGSWRFKHPQNSTRRHRERKKQRNFGRSGGGGSGEELSGGGASRLQGGWGLRRGRDQ